MKRLSDEDKAYQALRVSDNAEGLYMHFESIFGRLVPYQMAVMLLVVFSERGSHGNDQGAVRGYAEYPIVEGLAEG